VAELVNTAGTRLANTALALFCGANSGQGLAANVHFITPALRYASAQFNGAEVGIAA
tara:strand:- start:9749 stop:9919 length:171 start_codon:yes stop_codon:yes gene_type:complete